MTTGRDHPIEVMISRHVKGKMPKDATKDDWREFHTSFRAVNTTAHGLAVEIYRGYSFCPLYFGRRLKQNFVRAWHIAVDFDTADDRSSLESLSQIDLVKNFASFAYTTASHKPEQPKARVVWILEESITDLELFENLFKALLWKIPFADQGVKDGLRLYYGSPLCTVWGNWSLMPPITVDKIITEYQEAHPKRVEIERAVKVSPSDVGMTYLDKKREIVLGKLAAARDGEKHKTLFNMAILLGGFAASGYYSINEVEADLKRVVDTEMNGISNYAAAYQTIEDGLKIGLSKPLYIERAVNAGDKQ